MMFVSCNSNTTGVTCGAGTAHPSWVPEFTPVFSGVSFAQSLVFCVMFVDHYPLFLWPLHCLSFDLWLLINPLICSFSVHVVGWNVPENEQRRFMNSILLFPYLFLTTKIGTQLLKKCLKIPKG